MRLRYTTTGHSKGYLNIGENHRSEGSAGDDAGCPQYEDHAVIEHCEAELGLQFKKGVIQLSG